MMTRTRISRCIATAFGGTMLLSAGFAVQAQAVQRVEITGSNIKRLQAEGALPVEVITRADFEKKGITTTNELIRSLSFMSSYNDELISNSPNTTGSATAGFRGLSGDQTVVLLNGRRLASYGFDGAFVNLNSIPLGAIQRVEVLKDGASAIYGADAIGGVINFITRKDYQGVELNAGYGVSSRSDSNEINAGITAGFGNLGTTGFNVLANLSYFKRDPLNNLDRDRTSTADYRRFGGSNQLSTFAPTGNFVNPTTGLQSPFTPCPSANLVVSPSPLTPGVAGSSSCVFDFAPYRTTTYGTERTGGLVSGKLKITDSVNAFAEAMFARSDTFASAAAAPGNFTLPVGHPANAFTSAITVRGRPLQAGPRTTTNVADTTRFLAGVEGTIGAVDFNVAVGQAKNKVTNTDGGYFLTDKMFAAIAAKTFDPFSLTNPASVIDAIRSTDVRTGNTTNTFVDAKASMEIGKLPGGQAAIAVGVVSGKEEIADVPGPNSQIGNIFGSIQQSKVVASRNLGALYAELNAPVLSSVEMQFAVRSDRYSGGVNSTTPKVAVRFQPMKEVLLRASYAEGFKMPSLRDLFGGSNQSADSVQDFPGCSANNVLPANCPRLQYDRFSGGNALLRPEKSKGYNFGVVLEPTKDTTLGADYFIINKTDEIGLVLAQFVIDNVAYARGATTTLGGNPAFSITRNAGGTITAINTSLGNLGERKIQGVDLSATHGLNTGFGRVTLSTSGTYYERYDYADQPGTPLYGRLELLNLPRWRTTSSVALKTGGFDLGLAVNVRAPMYDKAQSTAATPVTPTTKRVGNFDTLDLSVGYSGFKGVRLNFAVKNLLDKEPPFSNNDTRTLGFSQMDDIRGRFYSLGAAYAF